MKIKLLSAVLTSDQVHLGTSLAVIVNVVKMYFINCSPSLKAIQMMYVLLLGNCLPLLLFKNKNIEQNLSTYSI